MLKVNLEFPSLWTIYNQKKQLRVVISNQPLRPKFWEKICIFSGSGCMNAPFFVKGLYTEGVRKNYLFFPWRSTSLTYYPPNECKYRKYSLFCEMMVFGGKGRTPGESFSNCLQWTQLFSKNSTGSIALLVWEKIVFQNSKFWKISFIWPNFR